MIISNKKVYLLCILDILKEYSDETHFLTQEDIVDKMSSIYDCIVDRKTVSSNIQTLLDFDYQIVSIKNKGVYLAERKFDKSQITFLIDSVFSSKVIPNSQSKELTKILLTFLSKYERKNYNYLYKTDNISKTDNKQLFFNISQISEAITKGKQISFSYKRNIFSETPRHYPTVNPYFMANSQGKYYIVCNYNPKYEISNLRLDKIVDVQILETDIQEHKEIDITEYLSNNVYMFGGVNVNATLLLKDETTADYVFDWFSVKKSDFYKKENNLYVNVKSNEQALIYWCLQYGEYVELIEPISTRQKIATIIKEMNKKYL